MNRKRSFWIFIGVVILITALVSGFVLMQPSAEDILIQTLETMQTIDSIHAVVEISAHTIERSGSATVEVWGRHAEDGPGAFRLEVLETSEGKAEDAVVVSDGETLWAYSPSENKVFIGTIEDVKILLEEKELEMGDFEGGDFDHPENAEDAVRILLDYFTAEKSGTEEVANTSAYLIKLGPIPEQMPSEFAVVGGFFNLWVAKDRNLPLAFEYSGGSIAEVSVTTVEIDINNDIDDDLFSFEIPPGIEIVTLADIAPQSLSMEEAVGSAEFDVLIPTENVDGATLVDILEVRGAIVQRYTLPDGGSFTVAQGVSDEMPKPSSEKQVVEVRGVSGTLFTSEDGNKVLLTWAEGELFFSIAGDLNPAQALMIAESLQ